MNDNVIFRMRNADRRRGILGTLLPIAGAAAMLLTATPAAHATARGVNMTGLEWGSAVPGTLGVDFLQNSDANYNYFGSGNKGFNVIRVPFLWERLQRTLNGALDTTYLGYITNNINWAKNHGCQVILDVHNYGRYNGNVINGGSVTRANFNDLWTKLSTQFKNETGVYAYDLMNEPHDMGSSDWHGTSQAALTAIRNNGDNKMVMVEGDGWAGASSWASNNGATGWITDSANNFKYEAHQYFDGNGSGVYSNTYDWEVANTPGFGPNIGVTRLQPFRDWCTNNGVKGFLGEYSVPATDSRWNTILDNFLTSMDQAGFDGTYWSASEGWPASEPTNVQPTNNYTTDRPQMPTLVAHKGGSSSGPPSAPTGLAATAGNAQATLSWSASSGATSYNVKRSTVSGSGYAQVTNTATTNYTNTGLTNGTTYYFVVSALNASGESANSAQASATPASGGTSGLVKINAGGPAVSPFVADANFSGGTSATNWTGAIDTSAVSSPAPQAVYQSERWGASTYTIAGLTAGTTYTVRLHFCENYFTASGLRTFNVAINGVSKLSNFDIYATTGAIHKANIQQFNVAANGSGQEVIAFTNVVNNALINGIEVNTASGGSPPSAPAGLSATAGNAQAALSWTASSGATSYNVLRSTVNGSGYASVATGIATTSYTNTGLANGTTYYFVVTATNSYGTSGNSNQASATPTSGGGGNLVPDGTYSIIGQGSGMAIDDPNLSSTPGTQMDQWTVNGGGNQRWTLTNLGGNTVKLVLVLNGLALGVRGGSTATGAAVEQNTWSNAASQKWIIAPAGTSGFYTLKNVNSNLMIDVVGASTTAGALIDQWTGNGQSNQAWRFQ